MTVSGPGARLGIAWLAASALALGGCVSTPSARVPGPARTDPGSIRQSLFRLIYDGGEGRTGLRVVLRREGVARFQLAVSDLAGRAVVGLDYAGEEVVLVDHRARVYCVGGPSLRLTEVHPSELPLASLPRILDGELPVPTRFMRPVPGANGELVDEDGRRWRTARDGGRLTAWTLLDDAGPALWWTRQDDGGILSRRGGEQYRWSLSVEEITAGPLPDLVPADFAEGVCLESFDQDLP